MQKTKPDRRFDRLNFLFLTLITVIVLYPLVFVLSASVSDPDAVNTGKVFLWPRGLTIESYGLVLKETTVWTGYLNTIVYTTVDILISLGIILPIAYALSRPDRLKGAGVVTFFVTFTMLFQGGIIPLYLVMKNLKLINTVWAITLPNAVAAYLIIISRTFFRTSLPKDIYDSAEIDGASFTQTFFQIVVPLSTAIIAVVALFRGVGQWNNFFQPLLFLTDRAKYPLQLVLRNILLANQAFGEAGMSEMIEDPAAMAELTRRGRLAETMKYSLIVVSSAPVLFVYPFLQKYLMKGVMLGSIKG